MTEGLVSVVVPVYNVEKYLDRCVESIVKQTYQNLEIILVDDGSPDGCSALCDKWAKIDKRIKVIHKKNEGLGLARNTGIENATGEYIVFVDSDDWIECVTIEESYLAAKRANADIVCFGHDDVTQEGKILRSNIPKPPKTVFVDQEIISELLPMMLSHDARTGEDWQLSLSAWSSIFSMRIIEQHGWRFVSEREIISEDFYSVMELYGFVNKVIIVNKVFYHYVNNPKSLTQIYRRDRYTKIKYFVSAMIELSASMGCEEILKERINNVYLGFTIAALKQIVASENRCMQKYAEICRIVKDEQCQNVLQSGCFMGESMSKKILYWSMRKKCIVLCYLLVWLRNLKG